LNHSKFLNFLIRFCQKSVSLTLTLRKRKTKKIWYSRDQQVVATTIQKEQQAVAQEARTNPKDPQLLKAKPLQTERKKNSPSQNQNLFKATGLATTNPKAISGMALHHLAEDQNLIQAAPQVIVHRAIKNHLHHAASHTLAGQLPVAMKKDQKEVSVPIQQAKGSLIQAAHHLARTKDQKEALAAAQLATKNHTHPHVPAHLQVPKVNPKEVLAKAATVSLATSQPRVAIVSWVTDRLKAALKNATTLRLRTNLTVINQHVIRMHLPEPCVAVKTPLNQNPKTMALSA
jgi:hypothetical protein